ncbi:MAG: prolyl oligopeptidase family serine peptidase [Halioglobus sp.]|nr:prolyl oligopeptidase family serine peptidase [Halioglobus sp.]
MSLSRGLLVACITLVAPILVSCAAAVPEPGRTVSRTMPEPIAGYERTYSVFLPSTYTSERTWPVVIAIHGAFSDAAYHEERTGFSRLAEDQGFVVLYPEGIGILGFFRHWNAGHCCARALEEDLDDAGFIFAALEHVASEVNIDRRRVYVTGFSNGGMLTHFIGSQHGGRVAAIAPVAGALGGSETPAEPLWRIPDAERPVPTMLLHGTADDRVPYGGGPRPDQPESQQYLSVDNAAEYWRHQNGCGVAASQQERHGGLVSLARWESCDSGAEVQLWTLNNWRHTWPGPDDPTNPVEPALDGFNAAAEIWRFFSRHALPGQ